MRGRGYSPRLGKGTLVAAITPTPSSPTLQGSPFHLLTLCLLPPLCTLLTWGQGIRSPRSCLLDPLPGQAWRDREGAWDGGRGMVVGVSHDRNPSSPAVSSPSTSGSHLDSFLCFHWGRHFLRRWATRQVEGVWGGGLWTPWGWGPQGGGRPHLPLPPLLHACPHRISLGLGSPSWGGGLAAYLRVAGCPGESRMVTEWVGPIARGPWFQKPLALILNFPPGSLALGQGADLEPGGWQGLRSRCHLHQLGKVFKSPLGPLCPGFPWETL